MSDEFIPVTLPSKNKNKFSDPKNVFWMGIVIGAGGCLSASCLLNVLAHGEIRELLIMWQQLPWQVWLFILFIFVCNYSFIRSKIKNEFEK